MLFKNVTIDGMKGEHGGIADSHNTEREKKNIQQSIDLKKTLEHSYAQINIHTGTKA